MDQHEHIAADVEHNQRLTAPDEEAYANGIHDAMLDVVMPDTLLAALNGPALTALQNLPGEPIKEIKAAFNALTRAQRHGHVALHLPRHIQLRRRDNSAIDATARSGPSESSLVQIRDWLMRVLADQPEGHELVRLDGDWLYLERLHRLESSLVTLLRRAAADTYPSRSSVQSAQTLATLRNVIERLLPEPNDPDRVSLHSSKLDTDNVAQRTDSTAVGDERHLDQRRALAIAWRHRLAVIVGGPGTGKTYTLVRLLALLVETQAIWHDHSAGEDQIARLEGLPSRSKQLRIHLAAPTGKAAQRMLEAVNAARESLKDRVSAQTIAAIPDQASTLHRLLIKARQVTSRMPFDGRQQTDCARLATDLVVVDEASMVDLQLMTRLFEALPAHARIILVGDPDQLPSVGAGSVLAAIDSVGQQAPSASMQDYLEALRLAPSVPTKVQPPVMPALAGRIQESSSDNGRLGSAHPSSKPRIHSTSSAAHDAESGIDAPEHLNHAAPAGHQTSAVSPVGDVVVRLTRPRRFASDSGIANLATAILAGDVASALSVCRDAADIEWTEPTDARLEDWITPIADLFLEKVHGAPSAAAALTALNESRVLTAFRVGRSGSQTLDAMLATRCCPRTSVTSTRFVPLSTTAAICHGRPIMIRQNDPISGLFNGDIGVLWRQASGRIEAVFDDPRASERRLLPARLPPHESVYAMTIHKTQGSEFANVAIVLPDHDHGLLSRELLYTAVTRAKENIRIYASRTVLESTISRRIQRESALSARLTISPESTA
ncbi:MAG: AAA family ATPase [Thioalkalivibrionaceae bacterium]